MEEHKDLLNGQTIFLIINFYPFPVSRLRSMELDILVFRWYGNSIRIPPLWFSTNQRPNAFTQQLLSLYCSRHAVWVSLSDPTLDVYSSPGISRTILLLVNSLSHTDWIDYKKMGISCSKIDNFNKKMYSFNSCIQCIADAAASLELENAWI